MAISPARVPFDEAIAFFKEKVQLPTQAWTDLREGMHVPAFVVAGAVKADLIADLYAAVQDAIAGNLTKADFERAFRGIVAKHGWSYKGSPGWRSGVIYNTNLRMARAAGKWAQARRIADGSKEPVYLRYVAILDRATRPLHRAWGNVGGQGLILPLDHPFWDTHTPPNGWNCRCTIQVVTRSTLDRFGWRVTADGDVPALKLEPRTLKTPDGDEILLVPEGIDTGFGYNVGKAWGRGADRQALEQHGAWQALDVPTGILQAAEPLTPLTTPVTEGPRAGNPEALRKLLRQTIGGDEATFTDPTGEVIAVSQAITDHMLADPARQDGREAFFPFIPELIVRPQEIWIGFARNTATGRVTLRRRYVQFLRLAKDRVLGLVADADGNRWSGLTFFRGGKYSLGNLRNGLRIYRNEGR
ncbi:MAG: hypothetical protein HQL34_07550 [Alphaproteobacteria bacterium]|nr:hypothetical protein [Alphaproteobacteria bacterium]